MICKLKKALVGVGSFIASWLLLSYVFFPIKLAASPAEYFAETMTHMVPLKTIITLVFVLFAVFIYEQRTKKESGDDTEKHAP